MRHFIPLFFFSLFSLFSSNVSAQTAAQGKVTGVLQDATSKQPLGYATAMLLAGTDSSIVNSALVNGDGSFTLQPVAPGRYHLKFSLVGYATRVVPNVQVSATNLNVNVGVVAVRSAATQLGVVEVVGQREAVEYALDRRVYNVGQDLSTVGGTAVDVMQNVPSVTVDQEGTVSMRGTSNITILIDGKPSALSGLGLDQIPASTIERVEVITNPSSKYDPSGTGGVLNIILKKEKQQGVNGVATVNAGTGHRYNASLNLNYRLGKVNLFTNYDFRQDKRKFSGSQFRTTRSPQDGTTYQDTKSSSTRNFGNHNFRFGVDYQLTERQSLTGSVLYRLGYRDNNGTNNYRFLDENQNLNRTSTRTSGGSEDGDLWEYSLSYRKTFENKGRELTADAVFSNEIEKGDDDFDQLYFTRDGNPDPNPDFRTERQRNASVEKEKEASWQLDYIDPIGEKGKWEAGYRTTFEREDADILATDFNLETGLFVNSEGRTNHFVYDEWVHAIYGNYGNVFNKFSYQLGARLEQTNIIADQRTQKDRSKRDYLNLFPSLFLTYEFSELQKIQTSYSRRIDRPGTRQLNPFQDISDRYSIRQGNPDLDPEFIDSYELNYLRFWDHTTATASVFYRKMTDVVQSVRYKLDDNLTTISTYENIASGTSYGLELTATATVLPWWRVNANASAFNYSIDGREQGLENNSRFSWTSRLNNNFTLPYKTEVQLSASYRSPVVTVQGERSSFFMTDLSARKEVLKGKGNITLRVQDLFNTMRFNSTSFSGDATNGFEETSRYKPQSQVVYVGFSYRFGNARAQKRDQGERGKSEAGRPDPAGEEF